MTKMRLLQSACAVVMLAAMPAFAQTNAQPADTEAGGKLNNPMAVPNGSQSTTTPHGAAGTNDKQGSSQHMAMHTTQMRHDASTSQDATVDQLNDQSYQAAHNGRTFSITPPGDMSMPSGSGHTDDTSK